MIQITDKYFIDADPRCYILKEKSVVKDENAKTYGEERFKELGYYVTLEQCVHGILKTELRKFIGSEQINSINDLKNKIDEVDKSIANLKRL